MERISNEQKAKEIAKLNGINYKNHSKYEDDMDSTLECYKSALEAMRWKDEKTAFALSFLKPRLSANEYAIVCDRLNFKE